MMSIVVDVSVEVVYMLINSLFFRIRYEISPFYLWLRRGCGDGCWIEVEWVSWDVDSRNYGVYHISRDQLISKIVAGTVLCLGHFQYNSAVWVYKAITLS